MSKPPLPKEKYPRRSVTYNHDQAQDLPKKLHQEHSGTIHEQTQEPVPHPSAIEPVQISLIPKDHRLPPADADLLHPESGQWNASGTFKVHDEKVQDGKDRNESAPIELQKVLHDWSATGRGPHIDFEADEDIPLTEGKSIVILI